MKKFLSVMLSVLLLMTCMIPFASATDRYENEATATVLLDWIDGKIAEQFEDFNAFAASVGVDISVTKLDDLIGYKDHLAELGGDFANLDTSAIVARGDNDSAFIDGMIQFMADNADTFGKVFRWDDQVFDYGKVGEYIETLDDGNEIKDFYKNVLTGEDGNIQKAFTKVVADEMGYNIPANEKFDDTLNNGIKAAFADVLKSFLKTDASKTAYDAFDLRTTDIYTLVKEYVTLVQSDNKTDIDAIGNDLVAALNGVIEKLQEVLDGIDLTPPSVEIGDLSTVAREYHPTNTDVNAYMPTIYTDAQYKALVEQAVAQYANTEIEGTKIEIKVDDIASFDASKKVGTAQAMADGFKMVVKQGDTALATIQIPFEQIKALAEQKALEFGQTYAASMGGQIDSVDVDFAYNVYTTDDTFVMDVVVTKAVVNGSATFNGISIPIKDYDVSGMIASPVATILVENLAGGDFDLSALGSLQDYIDYPVHYDADLLDFVKYYDQYKGVVGQANRVLCDAAEMILTDPAYTDLGLTEGGNENLTANVQKVLDYVNTTIGDVKGALKDLSENETVKAVLGDSFDFDAAFASVDLGVIEDVDFSSVEGFYVSIIKLAGKYIPENLDKVAEIIDLVDDYDTLDDMFIALINKCAADLTADENVSALLAKIGYTYTNIPTGGNAKDNIMKEAAKAVDKAAAYAVSLVNEKATELAKKFDDSFEVKFELGVSYDGNDWEGYFNKLTDRFIDLTTGLTETKFDKSKSLFAKAGDILFAVLPMESMFSNVASGADVAKIPGYIFDEALNGNFDNFLRLFEVKDDAVAGNNTPVTKALINASQRIVDEFFPGTVVAANYPASTTVQDTFTGSANDAVIAANNMRSINAKKAALVPCALNLVKESGILTAICAHKDTEKTEKVAATCTTAAKYAVVCKVCGTVLEDEDGDVNPNAHSYGAAAFTWSEDYATATATVTCAYNADHKVTKDATVTSETTAATAKKDGKTVYTATVTIEGKTYTDTKTVTIPKTGDSGSSGNFFTRIITSIRNVFNRIINAIKNLFK